MIRKLSVLLLVVTLLALSAPVTAAPPPQAGGQDYVVQVGDTLAALAETALGDRDLYPAIAALTTEKAIANSAYAVIGDPQWLEPGWQIYLPTADEAAAYMAEPHVLRLSTTSSTADTGLLDAILPDFNANFNAQLDYIAVGTGQAIEMGAKGDVDVVLVHARAREDKFVAGGDGINRLDVMYNDFILVGPAGDPAGVAGIATVKEALAQIADKQVTFVSRGDDSGTYTKEKSIWASAGITPTVDSAWYFSIGQGMGDTLTFTHEKLGYTLTDRGTWLAMQESLPDLMIVVGGDSIADNHDNVLLNPYGVIPVNPDRHPGVNFLLATVFTGWMTSPRVQQMIAEFGTDEYGQSLFYPNSEAYRATQP